VVWAPFLGVEPPVLRWSLLGAVVAGAVGGVVGLVVGLFAYPPTAWFAVFELAIPSAAVGALVGLVCSTVATFVGRADERRTSRNGERLRR
jgi:hypothetical protein